MSGVRDVYATMRIIDRFPERMEGLVTTFTAPAAGNAHASYLLEGSGTGAQSEVLLSIGTLPMDPDAPDGGVPVLTPMQAHSVAVAIFHDSGPDGSQGTAQLYRRRSSEATFSLVATFLFDT